MTFKHVLLLIAIAIVLLAVASHLASAQSRCGPHDSMTATLAAQYKESQAARATVADALVELFVSEAGTWTMLVTNGSGVSCILAAGDGWESIEIKKGQGA